jgi:indolepyruvate ferredoxin oxidoreductase beta subunit
MAIDKDPINLIITGVGGQGNILASQLIASSAIREGLFTSVGETYGASQRGGSVTSQVRFSREFSYGPLIPAGEADIVVGFEPLETLRVLASSGNETTRVIFNPRPNYPVAVLSGAQQYPELDDIFGKIRSLAAETRVVRATELAKELGLTVAQNVIMTGALAASGLLPVPVETFEATMNELFEDPEKRDFNFKAFRLGVRGYREAEPL